MCVCVYVCVCVSVCVCVWLYVIVCAKSFHHYLEGLSASHEGIRITQSTDKIFMQYPIVGQNISKDISSLCLEKFLLKKKSKEMLMLNISVCRFPCWLGIFFTIACLIQLKLIWCLNLFSHKSYVLPWSKNVQA